MKDTNNQGKSFQERLAEAEERRKNATISDIIAAKRREADSIEASARGSFKAGEDWDERPSTESDLESALDLAETKRKEADRLEAAWKRDTKELRVEIERLKEERNYSGVRERERLRAKGFAIVPKEQLERGDAAKLREALNRLVIASEGFLKTHSAKYYVDTTEALDKAKAALAAPPRNCDVGSAEGQYARFVAVCHANVDLTGRCRESCPFRHVPAEYKCDRAECFARWAQLPYKEGGAR